jgi:hypothetical protein
MDISLVVGPICNNCEATSAAPCNCDISNAWMITLAESFVVLRHVTAQSWGCSDLKALAAAAMESAAIDISLTLLLSTNQESLFANSKSSK